MKSGDEPAHLVTRQRANVKIFHEASFNSQFHRFNRCLSQALLAKLGAALHHITDRLSQAALVAAGRVSSCVKHVSSRSEAFVEPSDGEREQSNVPWQSMLTVFYRC